jgi:hypothetical protein
MPERKILLPETAEPQAEFLTIATYLWDQTQQGKTATV